MVELTRVQLQSITILAIIVLGALFIVPFLSTLLFAAILAYLVHPIYKWLIRKINPTLSAVGICVGLIGLLAYLINIGVGFVLNELGGAYFFLANLPSRVHISPEVSNILRSVATRTIAFISDQAASLPTLVISTFLFFIALFYFLKEGHFIFHSAWKAVPLPEEKKAYFLKNIKDNIDAFVYVTLTIGMLQGIFAGLGFKVMGLQYPLLAGLIAGILSVIPVLGPYFLYAGAGVYLFANNFVSLAIGIVIYGLVIGSLLDYGVRPYFMSRKAHAHPLIVFLGIFGGLQVIGILGIIIGPIILSVAVNFMKDLHIYGTDNGSKK